jgi:uncharacterized protein YbbK (DUF523 family)
MPMEKLLISACLTGEKVRYDGGNAYVKSPILRRWISENRLIPFCPEITGGLKVPRPPAEIQSDTGEDVLLKKTKVITCEGKDISTEFMLGAQRGYLIARKHRVKLAILKSHSPACGLGKIYDGSFSGILIPGNGVFASLLIQNGIKVLTETQLTQAYDFLKLLEDPI